jgi:hypothetical protein
MRDDYGLRLLAEIGIDVYVPRAAPAPAEMPMASPTTHAGQRVVLVSAAGQQRVKLVDQVERALRSAGLDARRQDGASIKSLADAHAVVVLGAALARSLGAVLPAPRQAALEWVIATDADTLAPDAVGKRALWGEIKRLARSRAGDRRKHAD